MTMLMNQSDARRDKLFVPVLFTVTIFTSALLLFFVQPLFTRLVLPQIGGAAAVWTTAMLFFQTVLIGGYVYAHLLTRHVPVRLQIVVHLGLLGLALLFLPLAVPGGWSYDADRPVVTQTLWLYTLGVGLPFAVLSANAPLIQSWYRRSGGPSAQDPYFLYAASNLGSLIALLAFPLVAEPLFGVSAIAAGWSVGFVALGGLLLLTGLAARHSPAEDAVGQTRPTTAPTLRTMGYWAALAFIPSSLMLGVTTKISMDIGSFPLVWVIPLSLYLLTFVVVFSARSPLTEGRLRVGLPLALVLLAAFTLKPSVSWLSEALLLAAFFFVTLLAHRRLFEARPDAGQLTRFYIIMSIGGACGGIFNSLIAPVAFDHLHEVTATICLAAMLLITRRSDRLPRDLAIGLIAASLVFVPMLNLVPANLRLPAIGTDGMALVILFGALVLLRRNGVAAAVTVAVALSVWSLFGQTTPVLVDRSFFGTHLVEDRDGLRIYSNGSTDHGAEWLADFGKRPRPLAYYHRNAPLAQVMLSPRGQAARTIGIVGLGVGALACYGQPGQDWHFYEIDKKVVDIALDPKLFTFMSDCGKDAEIHLGDARIVLQKQTDLRYDILIIDAYSSDAVPVHLATREALALYRDRLAPGGLLLVHISNRFYDLSGPLAAAIDDLGLQGRIQRHVATGTTLQATGEVASSVVAIAATTAALGDIARNPLWTPLAPENRPLWTDDHADLLSALR